MATRYKDRITILEDAEIEELYGRPRFTHDERVHYFALTPEERAVADGGHRRIRSKSYAKGSGMIPRLDVAVELKGPEPGWRAALMGDMPLEQVTERLRGTIPILAERQSFAPKAKRCPTSIAPLGWKHISFNGDYVWPSEPLKQGFRPCKIYAPRSSMPLSVRFGTDSAMTPIIVRQGDDWKFRMLTVNITPAPPATDAATPS